MRYLRCRTRRQCANGTRATVDEPRAGLEVAANGAAVAFGKTGPANASSARGREKQFGRGTSVSRLDGHGLG